MSSLKWYLKSNFSLFLCPLLSFKTSDLLSIENTFLNRKMLWALVSQAVNYWESKPKLIFSHPEAHKNHCMNLLFGSILNARGWLSLGQVRFHGVISCKACAVSLRVFLKSYVLDRWFTERREEQPWVGVRRADRGPHPQRHHRAGRHHLFASREGHEQLGEERLSHRRVSEVPALDA